MSTASIISSPISQDEINSILWTASATLRGAVERSEYKNYILAILVVKYISDMQQDKQGQMLFKVPAGCSFNELYAKSDADNFGELLNVALAEIESANKESLEGVLRYIDFNSNDKLGGKKERHERLKHLFDCLNNPILNLHQLHVSDSKLIGNAVASFIDDLALTAGKSAGGYFTPLEVSELLARLIEPKPGENIYDPACGTGIMLIKCARQAGINTCSLYGQEYDVSTWAVARMNMLLHNILSAQIERGDTLRNPLLVKNNELIKFDAVVSDPPFGLKRWGYEQWKNDPFGRNKAGIPPINNGDFAWILHIIASMKSESGRAAVVIPHGILFRGGSEQEIRRYLIENDYIEAVISLGPNIMYHTTLPVNILLLHANKSTDKKKRILLINASTLFEVGERANNLSEKTISQINSLYQSFSDVPGSAMVIHINELAKSNWNLNISHHIRPEPGKLLENAITSIRLGLDDFEMGTDERVISSIRNLYAGLLLLFKEKLLRLSPEGSEEVLIKSQIVPVNENGKIRFKGEGKKTIELEQIKKRFAKLGIKFDWQKVDAIQEKRNDIEHYYTKDKKSAIREVISNTFIVISEFVRSELKEDPRQLLGLKYWNAMLNTSELYEKERKDCLELLGLINWQTSSINFNDVHCSSCGSSLIAPVMPISATIEHQYFDCHSCGQSILFIDLITIIKNEQATSLNPTDEMNN